jgi:hypothetical protein
MLALNSNMSLLSDFILSEEIEPTIEIYTVKLEIRIVLSLSICIYKVTFDNISITQYISLLSVLLVEETMKY